MGSPRLVAAGSALAANDRSPTEPRRCTRRAPRACTGNRRPEPSQSIEQSGSRVARAPDSRRRARGWRGKPLERGEAELSSASIALGARELRLGVGARDLARGAHDLPLRDRDGLVVGCELARERVDARLMRADRGVLLCDGLRLLTPRTERVGAARAERAERDERDERESGLARVSSLRVDGHEGEPNTAPRPPWSPGCALRVPTGAIPSDRGRGAVGWGSRSAMSR